MFAIGIVLLSLTFISAQTYQTNQTNSISVSCVGYTCSKVNITILYPNGTALANNLPMTSNSYYANYSFTPSVNGLYNYYYSDGTNQSQQLTFSVTPNGDSLSTANGLFMGFLMVFAVGLFLFFVFMFKNTLWGNPRDNQGNVMGISYKKYGKIAYFWLGYLALFMFFSVGYELIGNYFYQVPILKYFFEIPFEIMLPGIFPLIVITFAFAFISIINDKKLHRLLKWEGTY